MELKSNERERLHRLMDELYLAGRQDERGIYSDVDLGDEDYSVRQSGADERRRLMEFVEQMLRDAG